MQDARRPFETVLLAFEKTESGQIYYAAERVNREFLRDALRDHGVAAVRRFWTALKQELAGRVSACEGVPVEPWAEVEITSTPRTYEEICAMLGVEPTRRPA
jgi:hypothetical protein